MRFPVYLAFLLFKLSEAQYDVPLYLRTAQTQWLQQQEQPVAAAVPHTALLPQQQQLQHQLLAQPHVVAHSQLLAHPQLMAQVACSPYCMPTCRPGCSPAALPPVVPAKEAVAVVQPAESKLDVVIEEPKKQENPEVKIETPAPAAATPPQASPSLPSEPHQLALLQTLLQPASPYLTQFAPALAQYGWQLCAPTCMPLCQPVCTGSTKPPTTVQPSTTTTTPPPNTVTIPPTTTTTTTTAVPTTTSPPTTVATTAPTTKQCVSYCMPMCQPTCVAQTTTQSPPTLIPSQPDGPTTITALPSSPPATVPCSSVCVVNFSFGTSWKTAIDTAISSCQQKGCHCPPGYKGCNKQCCRL